MFELFMTVLFLWLLFKVIGLTFKMTWGIAKGIASVLMAIAVPLLFVCLLVVGGVALLIPVALIGLAFGVVKLCV